MLKIEDYSCDKYAEVRPCSEGLIAVKDYAGLWGFINKRGKKVIPCIFSAVGDFNEGIAVASTSDSSLCGYINMKGNFLVPEEYTDATSAKHGIAGVKIGDNWHIMTPGETEEDEYKKIVEMDSKRLYLLPYKRIPNIDYFDTKSYKKGYIMLNAKRAKMENARYSVYEDEYMGTTRYGLKHTGSSKILLFARYYDISYYDGTFICSNENTYIIIPKKGNIQCLSRDHYALLKGMSEKMIGISKKTNGLYGFLNDKGKEVTPFIYVNIELFSNGLAAVYDGNAWGYIDKTGKQVIPCMFRKITPFKEGLAYVTDLNGNSYLIDKTGRKVIDMTNYNSLVTYGNDTIVITANSEESRIAKKRALLLNIKSRLYDDINKEINSYMVDIDEEALALALTSKNKEGF